jgi:hypothetical protein
MLCHAIRHIKVIIQLIFLFSEHLKDLYLLSQKHILDTQLMFLLLKTLDF